jgi:type IV secretion system protein VirD4
VNIFFTQVMNELCRFADRDCKNQRLPVPVRFIMDDFATNCRIEDFPRMISSIRSRNISAMLMIQAESQLMAAYGNDGQTIIGNCDTYVYLGGNDTNTAWEVARRSDIPLTKILTMPQKSTLIFRRGEKPVKSSVFDVQPVLDELGLE